MDFNATIDLIIKDLDEALKIIDDLKRYPGVPALQVEIAKAKCKSASEVISFLKNMKDSIPVLNASLAEPQQKKESQLAEEKVSTITSVILNPPAEEEKKEPEAPEIVPPAKEQNILVTPVSNTPLPEIEKEEEIKKSKKISESQIMADKFSHLSSRFNEQLGIQKGEDDISDIIKTKPLSSLSDAIGVNDRFLFIREIFNDNKDAYTQALAQLDKSKSLTDARSVIMSYTGESDENKAFKQLLDLVKRKIASNE